MSVKRTLVENFPAPIVTGLRALKRRLAGIPSIGQFDFGDLRRLEPVARDWGWGRGLPVDRYYIEEFLRVNAQDIGGRVLEVGDNEYTLRFGAGRVTVSDVLHVAAGNPKATFVGDLCDAPQLPSDSFDAIVLTQVLVYIYDLRAAIATLHRILRPGGVLLVTVPGITPVQQRGEWESTWSWSFTAYSLQRLLADRFGSDRVVASARGNLLAAVAFLEGLSTADLRPHELDHLDPDYPLTVTARAVKA